MTARDLLERYRHVVAAKDWRGLGELLTPDAVFEFPFALPGMPASRHGRDAIVAAACEGWSRVPLVFEELRVLASHGDASTIAAECELATTTGTFATAIVLTARDGRIARLREYLDLLALAGPTGRAAQLANHLLGDAPRAVWERMIACHRDGDVEAFAAMFGDDGVMELPFTLPGLPPRLTGRDEIHRVLAPLWHASRASGRRVVAYDPVVVHGTRDPDTAIVEFDVQGVDSAGAPYRLSYVHVLRVAGARIARLRDYVDAAALGRRIAA